MSPQSDPRAVVGAVVSALQSATAFNQLPEQTRSDMLRTLGQVGSYVGEPLVPAARGLADAPASPPGSDGSGGGAPPAGGPTGRVGELARATLNAIDFPTFVSSLIKGTFQAIVDATIQQLEAYATLLQEVAKTVDEFMKDNVTEDSARDYLVDRYPEVLHTDSTGGTPTLEVNRGDAAGELPSFFTDLGFDDTGKIDSESLDKVIVPAARKTIAEQRHQTLATMVLLGLSRIVVRNGEINAKLQFHIDASELTHLSFDSNQTKLGNMARRSARSTLSGNTIMVNTANINAQSDLNIRTDLTGEVRVQFATDYLPLERFADSNAIQLINEHATVPSVAPQPPSTPVGEGAGQAAPPATAPAAAATQSLADTGRDPWSPRS
jgi:hypothetical protein